MNLSSRSDKSLLPVSFFFALNVASIADCFSWPRGADMPAQCAYIFVEHRFVQRYHEEGMYMLSHFLDLESSTWIADVIDLRIKELEAKIRSLRGLYQQYG